MESDSRQAQTFRCLTVEQQEAGVYAINALRYQPSIYDAVDNDTPLNDDEDYLYKPVTPGVPMAASSGDLGQQPGQDGFGLDPSSNKRRHQRL